MKRIVRKLACMFCISLVMTAVHGENWSLVDPLKGWNTDELVRLYFHNSDLQTQWAWKALSHYSFKGSEHVLDFGAGDGKLTALMSCMVPQGSACGVDLSESMVMYARKMYPEVAYGNLSYSHVEGTTFEGQTFPQQFDLVTSFCVFHLVPYPQETLQNIRGQMAPGSKFVTTFPIGRNPEYFGAVAEAMAERGWSFPTPSEGTFAMRDPDQAQQIFRDAGLDIEYFEVVETRNSFSSKEEMIDWFEGTLAANWNIPQEGRREFFADVTDRYLAYRPEEVDDDGFVYFSISRIDLVATPIF